MPNRDEAIEILERGGPAGAAEHLRNRKNRKGGIGGWDASLRSEYPSCIPLLWPGQGGAPAVPARPSAALEAVESLNLPPGTKPEFDAYLMVDWSASNEPVTGSDSLWLALMRWGGKPLIENPPTRQAFAERAEQLLTDELKGARILLGFDFPLGFPRGFACAHGAPKQVPPWKATWERLARAGSDSDRNKNNRFEVAAAINRDVSGAFGPFYGRPDSTDPAITATLSKKWKGVFSYPLRSKRGPQLGARREADLHAGTTSTPWFLYGGPNAVGGQALVGIPRVAKLRARHDDARVWPFETGPKLPSRDEARIVIAEIYPSLYLKGIVPTGVRDEWQVVETASHFAGQDRDGTLAELFEALPKDPGILGEEGWILGARCNEPSTSLGG